MTSRIKSIGPHCVIKVCSQKLCHFARRWGNPTITSKVMTFETNLQGNQSHNHCQLSQSTKEETDMQRNRTVQVVFSFAGRSVCGYHHVLSIQRAVEHIFSLDNPSRRTAKAKKRNQIESFQQKSDQYIYDQTPKTTHQLTNANIHTDIHTYLLLGRPRLPRTR